ncbi:MAG TPA: beta-L-arabinofuranosidase domain-containing protein, partial [Rectinemataceae bacterium]
MAKFSPHAVVGELSIDELRWTGGFWADRLDVCRESMIPNMWKILSNDSLSHAYANFRIAAGLEKGEHSGPPFFDGDLYKWLESVASVYAVTYDPSLGSLMDEVVAVIAKAQRSDGYIHTPVIIAERIAAEGKAPAEAATEAASPDASAPKAPTALTDRL